MYQEGEMANSNVNFHVWSGFGSENLAGCIKKIVLSDDKIYDTYLTLHPDRRTRR